ncbi:MAG: SRPBCC family protein [Actinomycetota bacterium]|nr:SRPBCC family protein [Actinomycetota bacterium]
MAERATLSPVRRTVTVKASPERAFVVFTEGIASWWPPAHHVGPTPADAVIEPFLGGRCYALARDGTQTDWGRVLDWDPPSRVRLAWLLTPQWQYEPDVAQCSEVEVRFDAEGTETTRVTLEHRGFERYVEGGESLRRDVDSAGGWGLLLERYAQAVQEGDGTSR